MPPNLRVGKTREESRSLAEQVIIMWAKSRDCFLAQQLCLGHQLHLNISPEPRYDSFPTGQIVVRHFSDFDPKVEEFGLSVTI
ncbi:unnamed protein product [Calypogeia fissa]